MKILVINCGSSSIKYKLYDFPKKILLAKGAIEKIGERGSKVANHRQGIKELFARLIVKKVVADLAEISAIGHRVVQGGEDFLRPHIIDRGVIKKIKEWAHLAPLHNPANLAGILGCREFLPRIAQVAVFDTAFYHSIPEFAYLYAIAPKFYKKYKVRRYGFHGTSHQFVAKAAAAKLKKPLSQLRLITCHLGNGCSITAVNRGQATDTSMGFTPLEGLIMGTRCGDIDVAAVFHIMNKARLSSDEMNEILNQKSGLLAISGVSNDMRQIKRAMNRGRGRARLAYEMFIHRIKKYIGAYLLALGGADAIVFTAGIGENCPDIINRLKRDIYKIMPKETKVLVIPTDEELMIAELTHKQVKRGKK